MKSTAGGRLVDPFETFLSNDGLEPPNACREERWYACYTRAHHEKKVDLRLSQRGVQSFLPMVAQQRAWHDRTKNLSLPLFPSYVFAKFELRAIYTVLSVPGIVTLVRTGGEPAPIGDEEIDNIRLFAVALGKAPARPKSVPLLEVGRRVRILTGPFAGIVGHVTERRGRHRVMVGLAAIGQGIEIDVPSEFCDLLEAG